MNEQEIIKKEMLAIVYLKLDYNVIKLDERARKSPKKEMFTIDYLKLAYNMIKHDERAKK